MFSCSLGLGTSSASSGFPLLPTITSLPPCPQHMPSYFNPIRRFLNIHASRNRAWRVSHLHSISAAFSHFTGEDQNRKAKRISLGTQMLKCFVCHDFFGIRFPNEMVSTTAVATEPGCSDCQTLPPVMQNRSIAASCCCGCCWSSANAGVMIPQGLVGLYTAPYSLHGLYSLYYRIISYHTISWHIISYHIMSYHIISYHIMSYHVISCHIILYHGISYHVISYHIISYHIISYHIISYHIISYHIMLTS